MRRKSGVSPAFQKRKTQVRWRYNFFKRKEVCLLPESSVTSDIPNLSFLGSAVWPEWLWTGPLRALISRFHCLFFFFCFILNNFLRSTTLSSFWSTDVESNIAEAHADVDKNHLSVNPPRCCRFPVPQWGMTNLPSKKYWVLFVPEIFLLKLAREENSSN